MDDDEQTRHGSDANPRSDAAETQSDAYTKPRRACYSRFGGPEVLRVEDVERPTPGPGQLLVRVAGASVNRIDLVCRAGKRRSASGRRMPQPTGLDFAGTVTQVPPETIGFQPGQAVWGFIGTDQLGKNGTVADFIAVPTLAVALAPEGHNLTHLAALPLVGLTAWQGLNRIALREGERVLIVGGAGGVGSAAIQIAIARGAIVETVASSRHADLVGSLGAVERYEPEAVPYSSLSGRYDALFDTAGVSLLKFRGLVRHHGGRVTTVAPNGLPAVAASRVLPGASISFTSVHPDQPGLMELTKTVASGQLKPIVSAVYPLAEISQSHHDAEKGHAQGKRVIALR
jgi:NADPH:quinone reductase-like Zn-dependent oxidoreductase